ncbi:MAG: SDR family oxidoreductase [Acidobacteria bacterium]|nr:SDR family oxidoreductase [Acidobacteriota bacterium]
MGNSLAGKVALITGASRGLGRSIAAALAGDGAKVALVARDRERLEETAGEIERAGGQARLFPADVTAEDEIARLEREVAAAFGRIDILVNNAGINIRKPLIDFTLEEWRRVMDTNVTGAFLMCRAFVPRMRGNGYGRIINMASMMSRISLPGRSAYCCSKAGLIGLTRALALELARDGITVNAISPGPFATEMNTALLENPEIHQMFLARIPLGRWGRVEEVGRLALYLCSEDSGFITGTDILIDGGWCAQ